MTDRVDIVVTDKVSPEPAKKLRAIASAALKADSAVDRLKMSIAQVDATALTRLAGASATLTNAHAREVSATARLENARARMVGETNKAALSSQRLATEQARTKGATEQAAQAARRARSALLAEENASVSLTRAKITEAGALDIATQATNRAAMASRRLSAATSSARQDMARTQNLMFQVQDVVVGLQAGQRPLTVLLQQGTQIAGAFGPGTGVTGILKGLVRAIKAMVAPFLPVLAVVGAVTASFAILKNEIVGATDPSVFADLTAEAAKLTDKQRENVNIAITLGDVFKATMQLAAESVMKVLAPAINTIAPYFTATYNFIISATRTVINSILGAFVGTYNAIKGLWGVDFPLMFEAAWKTAFNAYLSGVEAVVRGAINTFSSQINAIVGLYAGGYNAVINVWKRLPDAFNRFGVLAMNGLITVVETGVRSIIQALDSVYTFIGSAAVLVGGKNPFADLLDPSKINLDEYRRAVAPVGPSISQTIKDSFTEAFNRDYATGLRDAIDLSPFKQEISAEARGAANIIETAYRDAFSTDFAGGAFEAIRKRSVEVARERIASEIEGERATGKGNAKLSTKQKLLNDILGPLTDFRKGSAALNELLANGVITLGQYNQALSSLSLVASLRDLDAGLTGTPFADQAALDEIRVAEQERLNIVQQALDARIISEQDAAERIVAINRQASADIQAIETARQLTVISTSKDTFSALADAAKTYAGDQSRVYKALFSVSKGFAVAEAIIKTQQGVANALASGPPPLNFIQAGLVAAQGAATVATIAAQGLADGGRIVGPGGPRDDSIIARVSNGEYVVNAAATARNLPLLEAINNGRDQIRTSPAFRDGGRVPTAYRAPVSRSDTGRVGTERGLERWGGTTVNVFTRDPDTRIEVTATQRAAATARAVNRGQRNL